MGVVTVPMSTTSTPASSAPAMKASLSAAEDSRLSRPAAIVRPSVRRISVA